MFLKAQDYVEPEVAEQVLASQTKGAIKKKIKELIPAGGKIAYEEAVDKIRFEYIEKGQHIHSDLILELVKEVDAELHPVEEVLVVEEK